MTEDLLSVMPKLQKKGIFCISLAALFGSEFPVTGSIHTEAAQLPFRILQEGLLQHEELTQMPAEGTLSLKFYYLNQHKISLKAKTAFLLVGPPPPLPVFFLFSKN